MLATKPQMFMRAIQTAKSPTQTESLQNPIRDVQLSIAPCRETSIMRYDEQRLTAIAREIQQKIHDCVARF
jgi:hypothetical protein